MKFLEAHEIRQLTWNLLLEHEELRWNYMKLDGISRNWMKSESGEGSQQDYKVATRSSWLPRPPLPRIDPWTFRTGLENRIDKTQPSFWKVSEKNEWSLSRIR